MKAALITWDIFWDGIDMDTDMIIILYNREILFDQKIGLLTKFEGNLITYETVHKG